MASYVTAIQDSLEIDVKTELGIKGQFDVTVNGDTVVSRQGGLVALVLRKPWPSESDVVTAVRSACRLE